MSGLFFLSTLRGFSACDEWVKTSAAPPAGPTDWSMELVYDRERHLAVGLMNDGGEYNVPVRVYLYNGVSWSRVSYPPDVVSPPGPRFAFGTCYHDTRKTVLLYGGYVGIGGAATAQNDLWEWNGSLWKNIQHTGPWPDASGEDRLAYDPGRDRMILVTRQTNSNYMFWTWEWTGSAWEKGPEMGPISGPSFCFDVFRKRGFVYGNSSTSDWEEMWEYLPGTTAADGKWQKVQITGSQFQGMVGAAMAYEPYRRQILRFGGRYAGLGSTYSFIDGTYIWNPATTTWDLPLLSPSPDRRGGVAMCFNTDSGEMILFGGLRINRGPPVTTDYFPDTWRLIRGAPGIVTDLPSRAQWCPGGKGILAISVAGSGDVQWYKDGNEIPGATGKILVVDNVQPGDAGLYDVIVSNGCGEIYSSVCRVSVTLPPTVTAQPQWEPVICPDETIVVMAPEYEGTRPIDVQLQRRGAQGWETVNAEWNFVAAQFFFSIRHAKTSDSGFYRVQLTNSCGQAYSQEFEIQVGLSIRQDPLSTTATVCGGAEFNVIALGVGPLRYQWRLDGAALTNDANFRGVTTDRLQIQPLLYSHGGNYDVVVSDDCSPVNVVTSRSAKLAVLPGPQWVLRTTNGPAPREGHSLAYDPSRKVTILFSGLVANSAFDQYLLNDLWEWDGARWLQRMADAPNTNWVIQGGIWQPVFKDRPLPRYQYNLTYDAKRGRVVLFGGQTRSPNGLQRFLRDLWEWDGYRWSLRSTNGPAPRVNAAMAFDERRGVMVLAGGFIDSPTSERDIVWEWDGNQWISRKFMDGPATNYSQDVGSMVYDRFRQMIVFGPTIGETSTWFFFAWDGYNWRRFPTSIPEPLYRISHGRMAYDSDRRRTIHFGGLDGIPQNFTATFDGAEWNLLESATKPAGRTGFGIAYDQARHAVVMFGGDTLWGSYAPNGETWELIALDRPLINEQPASQYRTNGETAIFNVRAAPENSRIVWTKNGAPLVDSSRIQGANTGSLQISAIESADEGAYMAVVSNDCGLTLSLPAILTLRSGLQIFASATTATLIWTDQNVILEQADDPGGPWLPVEGATSPFAPSTDGTAKFFRLRQL